MKQRFQKFLFTISILAFGFSSANSQVDTTRNNHYDGLSLKDLLNVKIVSASKKTELLFEAPLSASVVTKQDIHRAGCTSIMEALRLVPGMIVREQSNGNYDIHLRGMDNVPPNAAFDVTSNTTTLVMIDGRPIYSYLKGGTFWETLPIDINDVEKIEIVRGPAAALYGPNAVNGVINILTRQPQKQGLYAVANNQQGSYGTFINNVSLGYKRKHWSTIVSANYQHRNRTQSSYFEFNRNTWLNQPLYFIGFNEDTSYNVNTRYPDPNEAMEKYAGNIFLSYVPSDKVHFDFSAGLQHSMVQKVSTENEVTPLSTAHSDSRYADLRIKSKNITAQFSYNSGTQVTDLNPGNKYDFNTIDLTLEYNYTIGKLSIKPAIAYRTTVYDDTKYSDTIRKSGIFNAAGHISSKAASIRGEYNLFANKLRLIGGITLNKFNYPDTIYPSYQLAASYKLNKQNFVRVVYSQAPRSSNVFDTYIDQTIVYFPSGFRNFTRMALQGNKNLLLLTTNMIELGYRSKISSKINIDIEFFEIKGKQFSSMVENKPYREIKGVDTITIIPLIPTNLPIVLKQRGVTVSLSYTLKQIQVKPFFTVQQTKMKNYSPNTVTPETGQLLHIYSNMGKEQKIRSTPTFFGGASINYVPDSKWNVNLNAYYYSSQTYEHLSNLIFLDGIRGIDHINSKLILNMNISYEVINKLHLSVTGKNLLNNTSREFFRSDEAPFMLLGGVNYEF